MATSPNFFFPLSFCLLFFPLTAPAASTRSAPENNLQDYCEDFKEAAINRTALAKSLATDDAKPLILQKISSGYFNLFGCYNDYVEVESYLQNAIDRGANPALAIRYVEKAKEGVNRCQGIVPSGDPNVEDLTAVNKKVIEQINFAEAINNVIIDYCYDQSSMELQSIDNLSVM
uniref:Pectinesterase inhibitor domain-containing protein n=1 Tax=Nelumbo nucifera TaxID=4432 RepID=A0A822ZFT6_NELNU|nr:TPA_asm: hypothetical protein HUJ06_002222 [Nelumbo nucifera]